MKFVCEKEDLIHGLNTVSKAVPVRTTMEILKCVLIRTEGDFIKITANDTSLGIETKEKGIVMEDGIVCVEESLFSSIIRKLPDSAVTIEVDNNNNIRITCEQSTFNIKGRDVNEFINLPEVNALEKVTLSQFTLKEMIRQVIFSVADLSSLNVCMNGVYLQIIGNKIKMTTIDGHRISIRMNELKETYNEISKIIPSKTLNDLNKVLNGNQEDEIEISFCQNHIMFDFNNTKMVSRVIEGEFFKIDSFIKEGFETEVKINKKSLYDSVERSTLLIDESSKKAVVLTIREDEMNIDIEASIGSFHENLYIKKSGKDLKIAFNQKFILDALRAIDDEEISIYFTSYNMPVSIKDEEGKYLYLILPVTVS